MEEESSTSKKMIPLEKRLIELLFLRLNGIYGCLWTASFQNPAAWDVAKDEWADALAGMPTDVIRRALDELRKSGDEYPPNLPKFIKICHRHFDLPSQEEVFQMIIRRDFSHPIATMGFNEIGSWEWRNGSEKDLRQKFAKVYRDASEKLINNLKQKQLTHGE